MATSGITFSGLTTGLDTASIIKALVSTEQQPITDLQTKEANLNKQKSTFNSLQSQVQSLSSALDSMKLASGVATKKATSSSSAVSVAVSGAAKAGSFDVAVTSLASSFKTYSNGVSARDQAGLFGTGTISVQVGSGDPINIDVDSTTTLDDVANKISAANSDLTVGVVYDGSSYRLQVANTQTGAANDVSITESGTTLGLANPSNIRSHGADAVFSVDGIPMTRSTNTVDDALAGVTLVLNGTTSASSPASVAVSADSDGMKSKISAFVTAYNAIANTITNQNVYTGSIDNTKLRGDSTLSSMQRQLQSMLATATAGAGQFNTLSSIGIATQKDGTLAIDDTKLTNALTKDPASVTRLFSDTPATGTKGLASRLSTIAHGFGDSSGSIAARMKSITNQTGIIDTNIARLQTRVDAVQAQLEAKYSAMESQVSQWKNYASAITNAIGKTSSNDT